MNLRNKIQEQEKSRPIFCLNTQSQLLPRNCVSAQLSVNISKESDNKITHIMAVHTRFLIFSAPGRSYFILLLLQIFIARSSASFCINTLSRSTCPDLTTFDRLNITAYGGRWYEIGSNAYFKNLMEAGGTCVISDYTPFNATNPGIHIVSGYDKQIGPLATSIVHGISLRAAEVCRQARQICVQSYLEGALFRGLQLVSDIAPKVAQNLSLEGAGLLNAEVQIQDAIADINESLQLLSANVSQLQFVNSNLSQGIGNKTDNLDALTNVSAQGTAQTDAILELVKDISAARLQIANIAGLLFGIAKAEGYLFGENSSLSTAHAAVQLFAAASLIQTAEETIPGPLAVIRATLAGAIASTAMLSLDNSGPSGATAFSQGVATQTDDDHLGKLKLKTSFQDPVLRAFNGSTSAFPATANTDYWVLATDGYSSAGYNAALVYGCHELPSGGVKQPLFIISRKPTLEKQTIDKFFNLAATLGIDQDCDEPFIFGVQDDSCNYPPSS